MAEATIPFEVRNRFSGEIQFTAQIECSADALPSIKLGLAVKWAIKSRADLSGANLSGANLSGAYLSRADLSRAYLSGANLSGAYLSRANLSRANLSRANLSGADLSRADLSGAYLSGANLSGADLSGANLSRANLSGANLSGAYLSRADLSRAYLSPEALRAFKADLWLTLSDIGGPLEAQHTLAKLRAGQVNGSTYGSANECACLVGTIANAKGVDYHDVDRNSDRPAERWFLMIAPGDKPEDETGGGFAAKMAVEWIEQWCAAHGHPTEVAEPDPQAVPA